MKKRVVYIMMFLVALLLGGCNLFSGLDKEDLDAPGAFEFKVEDAMANGDYAVVVGLIDSKIASNSQLSSINNGIGDLFTSLDAFTSTSSITDIAIAIEQISTFLDSEFSNSATKDAVIDYIGLKVTQAEAFTGEAGLKMTDIIAELTKSTSSNKVASIGTFANLAMNSSNAKVSLGDVVPESVILEKLEKAKEAYGGALPVNEGEVHKYLMGQGKDTYCLNTALVNIVSFVKTFLVTFSTNGKIDGLVTVDGADFTERMNNWNSKLHKRRAELNAIKIHLKHYADRNPNNGLINSDDIGDLNLNINEISDLLEIDNFTEYNTFKTKAGI